RSACAWRTDPDAVAPGIFGPRNLPRLLRSDFTENSNDSYWLANPRDPLEGFATIIGDERKPRSLRTRVGLTMLEEALGRLHNHPLTKFTRQQLQDLVFNDRQYGGELARDDAVALCTAMGGTAPTTNAPGVVALGNACPVLAAWDLHENLDSKGAVLWREFWGRAMAIAGTGPWVPNTFNPSDPVNTPNTLNPADPRVRTALGDAVRALNDNSIPLDAVLRDYQYAQRGSERIPIHGGKGDPNGDFNAINRGVLTSKAAGYGDVRHGSSFVQVVSFNGTPCPDTRTILTYSQSTNPNSPYFADQTRMFSNKEWVTDLFCEQQIASDPNLTTRTLSDGSVLPATAPLRPLSVAWPSTIVALLALGVIAMFAHRRARAS
ncbi:MAG: penicillin acylase family protein, partial [Candidatus Dormibacteraeota bacterium]|nr:penicillin acylase family protein [Candidatus Dormibacteraeota bacterium]